MPIETDITVEDNQQELTADVAVEDNAVTPEADVSIDNITMEEQEIKPPSLEDVEQMSETDSEWNMMSSFPHLFADVVLNTIALPRNIVQNTARLLADEPMEWSNPIMSRWDESVLADKIDEYDADPKKYIADRVALTEDIKNHPFMRGLVDAVEFHSFADNPDVEMTGEELEAVGGAVGGLARDVGLGFALPGGFITGTALGNGFSTFRQETGAGRDIQEAIKISMASGFAHGAGAFVGFKIFPSVSKFALSKVNFIPRSGILRFGGRATNTGLEFVGWDASTVFGDKAARAVLDLPQTDAQYNMSDALHSFSTGLAFHGAGTILKSMFMVPFKTTKKVYEHYANESMVGSIYDMLGTKDVGISLTGREVETVTNAVREAMKIKDGRNVEKIVIDALGNVDKQARTKDNIRKIVTALGDVIQ